jgi:hypothetical protein
MNTNREVKRSNKGATPPLPTPPLRGGEGVYLLPGYPGWRPASRDLPGANFHDPFGVARVRRSAAQGETGTMARVDEVKK